MRKFFCTTIAFTLFMLILSSAGVASAESDVTPPILNVVSVDKENIRAGETVTVTMDGEDDISGFNYGVVSAVSPSGKQDARAAVYQDSQGRWYADLNISQYAEPGIWKIQYIGLVDKAGNYKYYYYNTDFTTNFTVQNETPDVTPPVLKKVEFEKTNVNAGESFNVYLTLEDDNSGVNYIDSVITSSNNTEGAYLSRNWTIDSQGRYCFKLTVLNNVASGDWK